MIDRQHLLPVSKQAAALGISRRSVYYLSRPTLAADLALTRVGRDRFGRTLACVAIEQLCQLGDRCPGAFGVGTGSASRF